MLGRCTFPERLLGALERTPLAPFEPGDEVVDFGTFRFPRERTVGLEPSDQDGEITRFTGRVADAFDDP